MTDVAAQANAPEVWDRIWTKEGATSWRGEKMANVYARIANLIPHQAFSDHAIVDAGAGDVRYTPTASDTDTVGGFFIEWEVTTAGGVVKTFPNDGYQTLTVVEDLG